MSLILSICYHSSTFGLTFGEILGRSVSPSSGSGVNYVRRPLPGASVSAGSVRPGVQAAEDVGQAFQQSDAIR